MVPDSLPTKQSCQKLDSYNLVHRQAAPKQYRA